MVFVFKLEKGLEPYPRAIKKIKKQFVTEYISKVILLFFLIQKIFTHVLHSKYLKVYKSRHYPNI